MSFTIILVAGIAFLLGLLAMLLLLAISRNLRIGREFHENLMARLRMLPYVKMLGKRNIDVNDYLHSLPVFEIEKQLRNCETCDSKAECSDVLLKETTAETDYSFCPNDKFFKKIKPSEAS